MNYEKCLDANPVCDATVQRPEFSQFLSEAILHLLVEEHYPDIEEETLEQLLRMTQTLLDNSATPDFFLTNDLKVLVDIAILELTDLPPEHLARMGYLHMLRGVISKPAWARDAYKHRVEDAIKVLEDILGTLERMPDEVKVLAGQVLGFLV